MSEITFEGGCFCGAIRYRAAADGANASHCHCADCRRAGGAPFVSWVLSIPAAAFAFTRGEPAVFRYAGRERTFCGRCGTPLTFRADEWPGEMDVTAGSMDDPSLVTPRDHLWVCDRLPWIKLADGLPEFETRRPPTPG